MEGVNPRWALGWRGAREELAVFGNPSFINVKPSSAECRLTDITQPLTTDCLWAALSVSSTHIYFMTGRVPPLPFARPVNRQSIKAAFSRAVRGAPARRVKLQSFDPARVPTLVFGTESILRPRRALHVTMTTPLTSLSAPHVANGH